MNKKIVNNKILILIFTVLYLAFNFNIVSAADIPKPTSLKYVNDYAGVIDNDTSNYLVSVGKEVEDKTGAQITVVIINSLNGSDIESYSNQLFNEWGIGQKNKDNGLLILLSMKDRKWRVEVGKGLEGAITDIYSARVMDSVAAPLFKQGKYGDGIKQVFSIFADDIAKEYNVKLDKNIKVTAPDTNAEDSNKSTPIIAYIIGGLFLIDLLFNRARVTKTLIQLIFWSSFFGGRRGGRGGRGGGGFGGFGGGDSSGGFGGFGGATRFSLRL